MFQGIKSPEGLNPLSFWAFMLCYEISPSKLSWTEHKTSGIYVFPYWLVLNGPNKTKIIWEGESDKSCKSFGLFL
jgi:hypothetical protein